MASNNDDDSEDSDEEFLTGVGSEHGFGGGGGSGGTNIDREALIRKKLLENFYGKSAVEAAATATSTKSSTAAVAAGIDDDEDDEDEDQNFDFVSPDRMDGRVRKGHHQTVEVNNLDSPLFSAQAHTERLVTGSKVHDLLQKEEVLALQVRTLDSTMQTMVYENYSRFIDATDAIRSIGVNVQANERGLSRLTQGMSSIDATSKSIEDALGSLRDQVAEKIRVKRLLTRLDALLKLPQTLREQMAAGRYRSATRSYVSATSILSKHSAGFESLKAIEAECNAILTEMKHELKVKLVHWSGSTLAAGPSLDEEDDSMRVPDPPRTMKEIFECAGTLFILLSQKKESDVDAFRDEEDVENAEPSPTKLKSMASMACSRLLDRLLDAHLIDVQERRISSGSDLDGGIPDHAAAAVLVKSSSTSTIVGPIVGSGASPLIPADYLDAVLEAATLYGMSFGSDVQDGHLVELVSEAFTSFLSHVRSILFEETVHQQSMGRGDDTHGNDDGPAAGGNDPGEDGGVATSVVAGEIVGGGVVGTTDAISHALAVMVQMVRDWVSGLVLSGVGINSDYASKLVDHASSLTESMVRRRVDQKFHDLRLSVAQDCLVPFATRAVSERQKAIKEGTPALPQLVLVARSTLADCLQLLDDAIRSILSDGLVLGDSVSSSDLPDLKDSVASSTRRFAWWLATTFEVMVGGDSSDDKYVVEGPKAAVEGDEQPQSEVLEGLDVHANMNAARDDLSDMPGHDEPLIDLIDSAVDILLGEEGDEKIHSEFILAVVELCRLAEESVAENIDQSIATHLGGGGKRKSRGLFPSDGPVSSLSSASPTLAAHLGGNDDDISKRFRLASSRALVLYATNCGNEAASILCANLSETARMADNAFPDTPSSVTWEMLAVAKHTALECAGIFGGTKRASPLSSIQDDRPFGGLSSSSAAAGLLSRKTGLQLDVERMFKEKVAIYMHPSEILYASRDGVLFLVFKVAFRALFESIRMHSVTPEGYRQLKVDTEFLKRMVQHYVGADQSIGGVTDCRSALSGLLDDAMEAAEEQCNDNDGNADVSLDAEHVVGSFLAALGDDEMARTFVIFDDDDDNDYKDE